MANENPSPIVPSPGGGGTPPVANHASVPPAGNNPQPVAVVASTAKPPALFGGHRGGGKKREDGLVAGSPEAIKADRDADALRKRNERAAKKKTSLPPTLPSATPSTPNAVAPVAASASGLPTTDVSAVVAPVAPAPMFVPWQQKLLDRPAKLLTKIVDRIRCWSLMKRVKKLGLDPAKEKEIEESLKWKDDATNDFRSALSECAAVELNKRRVPGAENSHLINVVLCGGEMVLAHFQSLDLIEKLVAENKLAASSNRN